MVYSQKKFKLFFKWFWKKKNKKINDVIIIIIIYNAFIYLIFWMKI